jgi:hypothetical protein
VAELSDLTKAKNQKYLSSNFAIARIVDLGFSDLDFLKAGRSALLGNC